MAYPITETLFSMYRKKILRKRSPGDPDGVHLHMLVYKCVVRPAFRRWGIDKRHANPAVAVILVPFAALPMPFAILFYDNTAYCLVTLAVFVGLYLVLYDWLLPRYVRFMR